MAKDLVKTLADLKEEEALEIVQNRLNAGDTPLRILDDARRALEIVGKRFSDCQYFIPDLVYSGEILKRITDMVKPKIAKGQEVKRIGKDIVVFMLDVNGFEVFDLGIDVPAQKFVDKIKETGSKVVGLSGFLTLAFESMKDTVEAIKKAGLRSEVKIMIGGGQIDEQVKAFTGADAYGKDAMEGVKLAKGWIGG
jgi:5-methyltetrahydrofolate--homocysteine methyltransferase